MASGMIEFTSSKIKSRIILPGTGRVTLYIVYKKLIKPFLFLFSPDFVHNAIVVSGRVVQFCRPSRWIVRKLWRRDDLRLSQDILGLKFVNPVGLSAGFDKNIELTPLIESVGFGFEIGGSVTMTPRAGNERPWFYRLPKTESIVVYAGLANRGVVKIGSSIKKNQSKLKQMPLSVSVAVVAKTTNETCQEAIIDAKNTALYILQHNLAQMIEINISCPNAGDDQPFSRPEMLEELLTELDKLDRDIPFFVKMPNLNSLMEFDELLKVISRHNVQGVTIANLVKDRLKVALKDELPDDIKGGLSGAPTRQPSTELIKRAYQKYGDKLIIIGVGGIFTAEHAYEKIKAGASLVGMITGMIFEGPQVVGKINQGLARLLEKDGFSNITEAIGADVRKNH